ncbi:MAG: hypothetical protein K2G31_01180, partial [Clostridia bacterium]|nr:hypothetical protein [Clostridia bacterium]
DTQYINTNGIEVKSFAVEDEWNAAILNCTATVEENNFYSISIDVGCYAKAVQLTVYCDIYGVNDDGSDNAQFNVDRVKKTVFLDRSENETTITFNTEDFSTGIYSFKYLHAYIEEDDSFKFDNDFYFYGGQREKIRIQYASSEPNNFLSTICRVLRTRLKSKWDIDYTILRKDQTPEYKGYDIYIFEHTMPDVIPTDGIVLLLDPDKAPTNAGFRLGDRVNLGKDATLGLGTAHDITKYVDADKINLTYYKKIVADGYDELLYYANDPVLLVKNEEKAKIVVCTFNLNYSDVGIRKEFPLLMYNIFNYFLPSTVNGYAFEIGETLTLNARGVDLSITSPESQTQSIYDLPYEYRVDSPGAYTLTQTLINGNSVTAHFFVKVPSIESNITNEVDSLPLLHVKSKHEYADKDLLMYFAAAMFAILFIEWLLQAREYFR